MTADRRFVVVRTVRPAARIIGGLTDRHIESMRTAVLMALPDRLVEEFGDRVVVERLDVRHATVVVPLIVERDAARALCEWVMHRHAADYEIGFIEHGANDQGWQIHGADHLFDVPTAVQS